MSDEYQKVETPYTLFKVKIVGSVTKLVLHIC